MKVHIQQKWLTTSYWPTLSGNYSICKRAGVIALALLLPTSIAVPCFADQYDDIIDDLWPYVLQKCEDMIEDYFQDHPNNSSTLGLYYPPAYTINILRYAAYNGRIDILDNLAELFLMPINYLQDDYSTSTPATKYLYLWHPDYATNWYNSRTYLDLVTPAYIWQYDYTFQINDDPPEYDTKPREDLKNSAQFIYLMVKAINLFLDVPAAQRTANMNNLITSYATIVHIHHYKRWVIEDHHVYQTRNWGCNGCANCWETYNFTDFLVAMGNEELGDEHSYCNVLSRNRYIWTIGGVVELLAAHQKDSTLVPIGPTDKQHYLDFIDIATDLLQNRVTPTSLTDFDGNPVTGLNIDSGRWREHHEFKFAGYEELTFPTPADESQVADISKEFGHARSLIHMFDALYRYRHVTGQTWPDFSVLEQVANQVAYKCFNKDLAYPKFRNYWNGSNGWFRVTFYPDDSPDDGYPPYQCGRWALTGGYALMAVFNSNLDIIANRLWEVVTDSDQTHAQEYFYARVYSNGSQRDGYGFDTAYTHDTRTINTIRFLPSWRAVIKPDKATGPSPADIATGLAIDAHLTWLGAYAKSFDVYFGTTNPPPFQVNQSQAAFAPGTMNHLTQYFWRIDSVNDKGTTMGQVWSFTTKACPGDFYEDHDVDQEDFGIFQACLSGDTRPYQSGCEKADLDPDGDVDLDDFGIFQSCMGGANQQPGC
ncbi:MAG: hypothetical protein ACYTA5_12020 [Planctomycetota bacterium]